MTKIVTQIGMAIWGIILKYAISKDKVASIVAYIIKYFLNESNYTYFPFWEQNGFHITPNHFYQPIPDTRMLKNKLWEKESKLVGIDMNSEFQLHLLQNVFPKYSDEYNKFPQNKTDIPYEFCFNNSSFSGTDALVLYCMVRYFKPEMIIEVGSGYSTFVSANASLRNGNTKLICIEPYPNEILKQGFSGLTDLIPQKVEDVDLDFFSELESGDILFIDTSHVVKIGGDVNFLYLEVLPRLKKGVIVHIHDIFFPMEFPKSWVLDLHLFWTEQYLLQAFLAFNSAFKILFCNSYMGLKYHSEMKSTFPYSSFYGGGSIWIQKI